MQKKQGISLIVLSITILVMAILAATAIIALEDSGIIKRSKDTVKNSNYADEYTRLIVIKNGILTDNLGTITVEEYVAELRNNDLLENGETTNADGSVTVTTKTGIEVKISQNGTNDLVISMEGYTPPTNNTGNNNAGNDNGPSTELEENKLSGKWQLNETLTQTGWASGNTTKQQAVNYTISYNGADPIAKTVVMYSTLSQKVPMPEGLVEQTCYYISSTDAHLFSIYHFVAGGECGVARGEAGYNNPAPVTMDFGETPQEVDEDFYDWFIANATKQ